MPRVIINRRKYKISDLSKWIWGEMKDRGITQSAMAERLDITQQAFSKKLKAHQFTYSDLLIIFQELEPSNEKIVELMRLGK